MSIPCESLFQQAASQYNQSAVVLNRLKERWGLLSRSDKILLLLAEVGVVAVSLRLLRVSELKSDWQTGLLVFGLVFAFSQGLVIALMAAIAAYRRPSRTRPPSTSWTDLGQGLLSLVAIGLLYAAGGYGTEWMFPQSIWATKWRYSLDSDLDGATYVMERRPHDCEFMSAPLGRKNCHYEKEVATVRIRRNQSRRQVSYDDGKTWAPADVDVGTAVLVTWRRVEE
jgi:hypothetical protein